MIYRFARGVRASKVVVHNRNVKELAVLPRYLVIRVCIVLTLVFLARFLTS